MVGLWRCSVEVTYREPGIFSVKEANAACAATAATLGPIIAAMNATYEQTNKQ